MARSAALALVALLLQVHDLQVHDHERWKRLEKTASGGAKCVLK
jgi:hypothetical protein